MLAGCACYFRKVYNPDFNRTKEHDDVRQTQTQSKDITSVWRPPPPAPLTPLQPTTRPKPTNLHNNPPHQLKSTPDVFTAL